MPVPVKLPLVKPAGANHGWKFVSVLVITAAANPENGAHTKLFIPASYT